MQTAVLARKEMPHRAGGRQTWGATSNPRGRSQHPATSLFTNAVEHSAVLHRDAGGSKRALQPASRACGGRAGITDARKSVAGARFGKPKQCLQPAQPTSPTVQPQLGAASMAGNPPRFTAASSAAQRGIAWQAQHELSTPTAVERFVGIVRRHGCDRIAVHNATLQVWRKSGGGGEGWLVCLPADVAPCSAAAAKPCHPRH